MIGYLNGKLISKNIETQQGIVQCGAVGYEVTVSRGVFDAAPVQSPLELWIHTHVREDALVLYGFGSEQERGFFRMLLSVQGLGPKHALSLLAEHGAAGLAQLIRSQNATGIAKAPGVGKKLAQRVLLDLSAKVEKLSWLQTLPPIAPEEEASPAAEPEHRLRDDLHSALQNLGFASTQIHSVLDRLLADDAEAHSFETALREALAELSSHRPRSKTLTQEETGHA